MWLIESDWSGFIPLGGEFRHFDPRVLPGGPLNQMSDWSGSASWWSIFGRLAGEHPFGGQFLQMPMVTYFERLAQECLLVVNLVRMAQGAPAGQFGQCRGSVPWLGTGHTRNGAPSIAVLAWPAASLGRRTRLAAGRPRVQ